MEPDRSRRERRRSGLTCRAARTVARAAGWAFLLALLAGAAAAKPAAFRLAPGVAVEAEDFQVERGWKVVFNGRGNYMVDIIGFNHISGERLLHAGKADTTASAFKDIEVPAAGDWRLWVRYEYPTFTDARFRVRLRQGGRVVAEKLCGVKDNPRLAFGDVELKAQYDPSWGSEGLVEEVVDAKGLKAGKARLELLTLAQPQVPGRTADRNIDLVYLSSDTKDTWREHYRKRNRLYPILDAFRDTVGPRWEVRLKNTGGEKATFTVYHRYNRIPWGLSEGRVARDVEPGAATGWIPLPKQDTAHFGTTEIRTKGQAFTAEVRPAGGGKAAAFRSTGEMLRVYLPPYRKYGEWPLSPQTQQRRVLEHLAKQPKIGKEPTRPLCYGGWMPVGAPGEYGKNYARIYKAIGMRSFHGALQGKWPDVVANLKEVGIPLNRSAMILKYRYPPTAENIEKARQEVAKKEIGPYLRWFDYGDEIGFGEWIGYATKAGLDVERAWRAWLKANRPGYKLADYWLDEWGQPDAARLRPCGEGKIARTKPRLFIDSSIFYEDFAIAFVARGMQAVKRAFGEHVLCGANYSGHPFYHPSVTMYVKWFRGGAADYGRHSEYFWQVCHAGPVVNGYIAEHFRAGTKGIPGAVIRQYTMPHAPGNTEASFLRTAFTHVAHGAKMLDFFGIGMNECFTENHIDHRLAPKRYAAIRDVTHSIGLVEDLVLASHVAPSKVALLVSDSTERWDFADITADTCRHKYGSGEFRKVRLSYHLERLGIWTCLTFAGHSPDLLVEEDLSAKALADYRVLYVVGDHLPTARVEAVERWVRGGGVLMATAGAGRFDRYGRANAKMPALLGLAGRETQEKVRFMRPRQELAFLKPLTHVVAADGARMPVLAVREVLRPAAGAKVVAKHADGGPAVVTHRLGKGTVRYAAALPGLAYLWTALQPPAVPDRGPGTHLVPVDFDPAATAVIREPIAEAGLQPTVTVAAGWYDTRLAVAPGGFFLPIANYNRQVGGPATVRVRLAGPVRKVTSAHCGRLEHRTEGGLVVFTIPRMGYGDMVRLDP